MKLGVSYFGNRIPAHYKNHDLPEIQAAGCSYVVHTFSENDLKFYTGTIEKLITLTQAAGLEAHIDPWGVGGIFGGEAFSEFLILHPDTWQVQIDGTPIPRVCLRSPRFQEFMRGWIKTSAAIGGNMLFWDEPQLITAPGGKSIPHSGRTCWCSTCRMLYADRYGEPMPAQVTEQVMEFLRDSVTWFITDLCQYGADQGISSTVCLSPIVFTHLGAGALDTIAQIPSVKTIGITPFWHLWDQPNKTYVRDNADALVKLCHRWGKEPQVWLQGFLIDDGRELEIREAADQSIHAGIRNLAVWGFQGCGYMSSMAPNRPDEVWRVITETFQRLQHTY
jgi:hypothetical protein